MIGGRVASPGDEVVEEAQVLVDVAAEVHGHEAAQLEEARVHPPAGTGVADGTVVITLLLEPGQRMLERSSFTAVGFTRQSTGPAMRVRVRGSQGRASSAMRAVAARAAGQGWHTARTWAPGPPVRGSAITWST